MSDSGTTNSGKDISHEASEFLEEFLDSMGWEGQIGQMAQIDINMLVSDDKTELRQDLLDHYIGTLGVGSVLNNYNSFEPLWKMEDYRRAVLQIQNTAQKYDRPPVIWGLDSVHGANYLHDTITTPQPINLAASFNTTLSYQAGLLASRDTRRAGIPWLFSPLLGLSWNPFWSRVYETFGEDPKLVEAMALAMVNGIQHFDDTDADSETIYPSRAAACGKHYIGYSMPRDGHDRAPSWIPKRHLFQYFVPPWKRVTKEVLTIMESYTDIDGVPNVANRWNLDRLLRMDMGYTGVVVTDYHEIFNLFEFHHTAKDRSDALKQSLSEGSVDMSMIALEPDDFFAAFKAWKYDIQWQDRIRKSARRVLELKYKLNMFEESFQMTLDGADGPGHSEEDLAVALDMTRQSIVLTKNENNILPLDANDGLRILVTGPTAKSQAFQTGGWSGQWQGVDKDNEDLWFTYGSTVVDALDSENTWKVSYSCGVNILGDDCDPELDFIGVPGAHSNGVVDIIKDWVDGDSKAIPSIGKAVHLAADHDILIVCLGEENYTEKPGDIRDLRLPNGQYELVAALRAAASDKKIILTYFGGRPRLLADIEPLVDAIFVGFLPGPQAGEALVDLISGRTNPSARLPLTYPKYEDGGGIPYLHAVSDLCTHDTGDTLPHWENEECAVQWPFGHGLSYSQFEYSNLSLSKTVLQFKPGQPPETLTISFTVTNGGKVAGALSTMLFSFDSFRPATPEFKRLRAFDKVFLEPEASINSSFELSVDDLRFIGNHDESHYILEDGMEFRIGLGPEVDCRSVPEDDRCSPPISIKSDGPYVAACEAACNLWTSSHCQQMEMDRCLDACIAIHDNEGLSLNNDGWGWNYVDCIEAILLSDAFSKETDCWKPTALCRDIFSPVPPTDEFGNVAGSETFHGSSTSYSDQSGNPSQLVVALALVSGILASIMLAVTMRGRTTNNRASYGGIQFTRVNVQE